MQRFKIFTLVLVILGALVSCTKTNTDPVQSQTIVVSDSSGLAGKLVVRVLDFNSSQTVSGADVFIYGSYDDIKRNLYLNTLKTNGSGNADFGFLIYGNYYLRATNGVKSDTAIAQIVAKSSITKNMFLK